MCVVVRDATVPELRANGNSQHFAPTTVVQDLLPIWPCWLHNIYIWHVESGALPSYVSWKSDIGSGFGDLSLASRMGLKFNRLM